MSDPEAGHPTRGHLLTRRDFLLLCGLGLPAALALDPGAGGGRGIAGRAPWTAHLDRFDRATRRLGRLYLDRAEKGATEEELVALLEERVPELRAADRSPAQIRRSLDAAIRADFARGDTVRMEGWLLSRTELRLAALAWQRAQA